MEEGKGERSEGPHLPETSGEERDLHRRSQMSWAVGVGEYDCVRVDSVRPILPRQVNGPFPTVVCVGTSPSRSGAGRPLPYPGSVH